MSLSRRTILRAGASILISPALRPFTAAGAAETPAEGEWRHGMSLFGDLKYPPGFERFEYVNPDAPKGGVVRLTGLRTFDNFNQVVAGIKGSLAAGVDLIYDTLMTRAEDEVSTAYGLLAAQARFPADFSSVTYRLRPEAKWHDGQPVTPDDVIFSFNAWTKYYPPLGAYYGHVKKVERSGDNDITFTFDGPGNRELPMIVGELTVLPQHWWEGTDKSGKKRNISETTLEPPLGSGSYRIKDFAPGRSVTFERVEDYWGRDLAAKVGTDNLGEIRYEYFRDSTVALEAFKADQLDWRSENIAKNWAIAYDFPAAEEKRVLKEEFPNNVSGVMQAFTPNIRRDKFKDARVRQALNYAFDFEEMNKQLFYGQYKRIDSYFAGLELASSGLPQGKELEILGTVRDKVPPEVFTKPYTNPVGGSPQAVRENLRHALQLLKDAGYEVRKQKLVNTKTNEPYSVELLIDDPSFERVMLFYKPSLERLGMKVSIRTVDDVQYQNRIRSWDFDVIIASWGESLSPGNEQRSFWGSQAADIPGSRNLVGIKNPAVDALVDHVIFAKSRDELVAATKALDRVLLWNHYVIPQWTSGTIRTVRWDRFSRLQQLPKYGLGSFPTVWWWDKDKAAKTGSPS